MTGVEALAWMSAQAFEAGAAGWAQQPGILLGGVSAEGPPPGLYMVDQAYTYQTGLPAGRFLVAAPKAPMYRKAGG